MSRFRNITLAAMLTAAPFAANAAGSGGGPNGGAAMYSPSPLIVQTNAVRRVAAVPHERGQNAAQQKPVRVASINSVGTSIYQPGPLTTAMHRQRLIAEINHAYGTSFAVHPENEALALNTR